MDNLNLSIDEIAEMVSEICDNPCNFSNTDEWLPYVCDYKDNCDCSNIECWKQYFKHSKISNEFWKKFEQE